MKDTEALIELAHGLLDEAGSKALAQSVIDARKKRADAMRSAEQQLSTDSRAASDSYEKAIRLAVLTALRALVERETGATITTRAPSQ